MKRMIKAGVFKAGCLKMMDEVQKTKVPLWITKHGKPVAKLVPVTDERKSLFGKMKGSLKVLGDIVHPIGEAWDADS